MSGKLFSVGSPVRLISHEPESYLPPIGSTGFVVAPADDVGDVDVLFCGLPCPNPPGTFWCVPKGQLAPAVLGDVDVMATELAK